MQSSLSLSYIPVAGGAGLRLTDDQSQPVIPLMSTKCPLKTAHARDFFQMGLPNWKIAKRTRETAHDERRFAEHKGVNSPKPLMMSGLGSLRSVVIQPPVDTAPSRVIQFRPRRPAAMVR